MRSDTTMASSTTMPRTTTRPVNVTMLMAIPSTGNRASVPRNTTGSPIRVQIAATGVRNTKSTTATSTIPTRPLLNMSCRRLRVMNDSSRTKLAVTPGGKGVRATRSRTESTVSTMSAFSCFDTTSETPGWLFVCTISPLSSWVTSMRATSATVTAPPPGTKRTRVRATSSGSAKRLHTTT